MKSALDHYQAQQSQHVTAAVRAAMVDFQHPLQAEGKRSGPRPLPLPLEDKNDMDASEDKKKKKNKKQKEKKPVQAKHQVLMRSPPQLPEDYPKRPIGAALSWMNFRKKQLRQAFKNEHADKKMTKEEQTQLVAHVTAEWRNMTAEDRQPYEDVATQVQAQYEQDLKEWHEKNQRQWTKYSCEMELYRATQKKRKAQEQQEEAVEVQQEEKNQEDQEEKEEQNEEEEDEEGPKRKKRKTNKAPRRRASRRPEGAIQPAAPLENEPEGPVGMPENEDEILAWLEDPANKRAFTLYYYQKLQWKAEQAAAATADLEMDAEGVEA